MEKPYFVANTAVVNQDKVSIGTGVKIWHFTQVMDGAKIGDGTTIGKNVFIDSNVRIGKNCKIQNNVSVYHGVILDDGVFVGPHVCFTNDMYPRAVNPDMTLKSVSDWKVSETYVSKGASIGANSTIRCGINIGEWAMIGAGSVVTKNVPAYALVFGNPASQHGYVCKCGIKLNSGSCSKCKTSYEVVRKK
ncbi:N-acetyltransferase [Candidatus Woesearchaeota archaeon]|nr:N-acetyltransferase [Candidatus Woesearchaeota archaeon]